MLFDSEHFSLCHFLQGAPFQQFDCKVGHGFHDSRFWMPQRRGPVMPPRRSNRLKTWRQSHGNRLQIGRQRRDGLQGWPEYGGAHSTIRPFRSFRSSPPPVYRSHVLSRRRQPAPIVLVLASLLCIKGLDSLAPQKIIFDPKFKRGIRWWTILRRYPNRKAITIIGNCPAHFGSTVTAHH